MTTTAPDRVPWRASCVLRVLVMLVVVAQVLACHALLPEATVPASAAATAQHGADHDVVCEPGAAAVAPAAVRMASTSTCSTPQPSSVPAPREVTTPEPGSAPDPPWTQQSQRPARHRLLAIGITRV